MPPFQIVFSLQQRIEIAVLIEIDCQISTNRISCFCIQIPKDLVHPPLFCFVQNLLKMLIAKGGYS